MCWCKKMPRMSKKDLVFTLVFVEVNIEMSKNVKFILKLQRVFKEIWKLIKEHICTSRRAVNAYMKLAVIDECLTRMQIASKLRNLGV